MSSVQIVLITPRIPCGRPTLRKLSVFENVNIEVRSNTVPNAHSGGDDFGYGEGSEGRPVRLVNRGVVAPWNYNSTGRNLGNQLRVLRQHITPNQHRLAVLANQPSHSLKLLNV